MDLVKDQEREGFAGVFVDIGEKSEDGALWHLVLRLS
jgi:hypothetical protein